MHSINKLMEQIDEATMKIFSFNAIELANEPLTNVVEAVWGNPTDKNQPTSAQRQIGHIIRPMIRKIQDALETEDLTGAKNCVIDYLIKRLVVSEIVFMIKCYELNLITGAQSKPNDTYNLVDTQVAGHA